MVSLKRPSSSVLTLLKVLAVLGLLYLFLISIGLIGAAFKALGREFTEQLIQTKAGPLTGLFVGILATSIVQSSSATTSLIVGMVAAGTFGDDIGLAVAAAIPYVMGANIGTSITNTIVALGHIVRKSEFERAFAASVIHDFFNILAVIVLLPLQVFTNVIGKSALFLTSLFVGSKTIAFKSPIKIITDPLVKGIVNTINSLTGEQAHWVILLLSLVLLFISLKYLTRSIRSLVIHKLEAFFDTHIFKTGLRAMFFGVLITVLVQSSSITTSLVIPLAGAGILNLTQIFPYTLGANVGTTITAILASLVSGTAAPLAVAFGHLLFNVFGILIVWPLPWIRNIPLRLARDFAAVSIRNRLVPFLYILIVFFIIPIGLIFIMR